MKILMATVASGLSGLCVVLAACGDGGAPKAPAPGGGSGGGSGPGAQAPYVRAEAPKDANDRKNPIAYNAAAAKIDGEALFAKHCTACHGTLGIGDGPTGKGANPAVRDLTNGPDFQDKVTDGYIFWKISEGNKVYKGAGMSLMYAFGNKEDAANFTSEEDRWKLVNYVRHLGGKK